MKDSELIEHPEGGRFKEVYRSDMTVTQGARNRVAMTHIYFSLNRDEVSRFHKVTSDEIWNLYEGEGVVLYTWDAEKCRLEKTELSRQTREYCCVIRAGLWQAAVPLNGKILVGCTVSPGFEFEDFELIDPESLTAKAILDRHPNLQILAGS